MLYQHEIRPLKDSSRHQKTQLSIDVLVLVQKNLATLNKMDRDLLIDDTEEDQTNNEFDFC